jgi:hypothetical protein
MQSQYATDPAFFSKTGDAFQVSIKKHATTVENLAAIYAAVGALIFFLSCLGNTMYVSLLTSRRIITVPLVFSYSFIISLALIYVVVDYLCLAVVRTASVPGAQVKNVADFHTDYDVDVIAGTTLVALIFAIYFSYRLIRWDGLPWCRNPLPVQPRSRAKPMR